MNDNVVKWPVAARPTPRPTPRAYTPPLVRSREAHIDALAVAAGKTPEQYRDGIAKNYEAPLREATAVAIEDIGATRAIAILEKCLSFARSQAG